MAATFPHGDVVPLLIFSSDFIAVVDRWRSSTQNGGDPPHKMVEILHTSGGDPPHITGEIHFEYLNQLMVNNGALGPGGLGPSGHEPFMEVMGCFSYERY